MALDSVARLSMGVKNFHDQNAFLASADHFLRMRRNAVISISGPKSVVTVVLSDIDFL